MEVPLESEDEDISPTSPEAEDNNKDAAMVLKHEILEAIHYTKSKLYFAGCDGHFQAFRAVLGASPENAVESSGDGCKVWGI